jgi:hypothetical protein
MGLFSVLWLPGCGSEADSATEPAAVVTLVTENFSGSIEQNGSRVHTFTVTNSGYTLLAGFTSLSPSSITALSIGIGTWDSSRTSGTWDECGGLHWNDIQNVPSHVRMLSDFLVRAHLTGRRTAA